MFNKSKLLLSLGVFFLPLTVDTAFAMDEKQVVSSGDKKDEDKLADLVLKGEVMPVAIIGSGTAGLTAALNLHRDGYNPVVFMGPRPKGVLDSDAIVTENVPGGDSIGSSLPSGKFEQAYSHGVYMIPDSIVKVEVPTSGRDYFVLTSKSNQTINVGAVIFAMGGTLRPIAKGVKGREEYEKKIWGDNAWTHTADYKRAVGGKNVTIIGSAIDAFNKAIMAIEGGARKITILVRSGIVKPVPALPKPEHAIKILKDRAKRVGIEMELEYNAGLSEIHGDGDTITHIMVKTKDDDLKRVDTDVLVNATGRVQNTSFVPPQIDKQGDLIKIHDLYMRTNVPGAFAAGDIIIAKTATGCKLDRPSNDQNPDSYDLVVGQADMAIGTGVFAAHGAARYLVNKGIRAEGGVPNSAWPVHPYEKISDINSLKAAIKKMVKKWDPSEYDTQENQREIGGELYPGGLSRGEWNYTVNPDPNDVRDSHPPVYYDDRRKN